MHLSPSIGAGKAPMDMTLVRIALSRQGHNVLPQMIEALDSFGQAAPFKNADLDLGHIEPTAMFGRVVELHPLQNPPGLGWLKSFVERSGCMGVQVILHDAHVVGVRIYGLDQPLDAVGIVDLGAMLSHLHMAPAR